jgi:hypothetical protein
VLWELSVPKTAVALVLGRLPRLRPSPAAARPFAEAEAEALVVHTLQRLQQRWPVPVASLAHSHPVVVVQQALTERPWLLAALALLALMATRAPVGLVAAAVARLCWLPLLAALVALAARVVVAEVVAAQA